MKDLKCLIVDDEPLSLDLVENFLSRLDIRNIVRCGNGLEAFDRMQKGKFDLLFLDIEMPQLSGLDLLKGLPRRPVAVIMTAYRDYAVEGFELDVLDYLVKPFSFPRFMQTMEKVGRAVNPAPDEIAETRSSSDEFLFIKADRQTVKIWAKDINYIESKKDYVRIHTTQGAWFCHQSLTEITAKLPPGKFFRLHRSFTVALNKIDAFRANQVRIQGKSIPVSRENRQELRLKLSPASASFL